MGIQPEKERKKRIHGGNQSFQELVQLYFPGLLLYLRLYTEINGKYRVMTLSETTLSFCIPSDMQSSQVIYIIIFWPRGLLNVL